MQELPDLTGAIKYNIVDDASREGLTAAWKSWVEETGELRLSDDAATARREAARREEQHGLSAQAQHVTA
jgi:hypothetical protein